MQYISTRGEAQNASASQAIVKGMAADGGLYVPEAFVPVDRDTLKKMTSWSYQELAAFVMGKYLPEFDADELKELVNKAYGEKFDDPAIAPLHKLDDREYVLELFHGPTIAFKDIALQMLPRLMVASMAKTRESKDVLILVATSGDTGKAALEGFCDVPHTAIQVFYPDGGVSAAQLLQMRTQPGCNVAVTGVRGNFDDTQTGVKRLFGDDGFAERVDGYGYRLSSANSINWGRLLPQIVYYFWSYAQLLGQKAISLGDEINFVVPTGNFGNILAGYYAKAMGLPVHKLICASNRNNVLTDFFETGEYDRNRPFYRTASPSMDILISSNLERLLFEVSGRDSQTVRDWMAALQKKGDYAVSGAQRDALAESFYAGYCDDAQGAERIAEVWERYHYLMDTHTAVAQHVYGQYRKESGDQRSTVLISTASPYKFATDVFAAIVPPDVPTLDVAEDAFAAVDRLSMLTGTPVPAAIESLRSLPIRHDAVCDPEEMETAVLGVLEGRK